MVDEHGSEQVPWPNPPSEPGPWAGGPPVAPPGNTALPPLPGAGGVVHSGGSVNPWANPAQATPGSAAPPASGALPPPPPMAGPPRTQFPGPAAPQGPLVDRAPAWLLVASALIVLALVAGAAYVVVKGGRNYPSAWDSRVRPIADWVERERKLTFDHPVEVEFLSSAAYRKASAGADDEGSPDRAGASNEDAKDQVAQLRALGFISGDFDFEKATKTLADSGTLAFYSPETKKVYVRGTTMTPALRVTLAHELTHVLQDQRFDLTRVSSFEDGRGSVLRALAEGDAGRVEDAYAEEVLSKDERKKYEADQAKDGTEARSKLADQVPPILTTFFSSPYILGPELITHLVQHGGDKAIDKAFKNVPSEEVLFNPLTVDTKAANPVSVDLEKPAGTKAIDEGEFGPTAWYLLLGSRLDARKALTAVDGWGGDRYVVFREDKKVCVRADARFDSTKDTAEFKQALTEWALKSPKGTASVMENGTTIEFRSCDPGKDAKVQGAGATEQILALPVSRTQVYDEVLKSGGTAAQGTCFGTRLVQDFTVGQLTDENYLTSPEGQQRIATIRNNCL